VRRVARLVANVQTGIRARDLVGRKMLIVGVGSFESTHGLFHNQYRIVKPPNQQRNMNTKRLPLAQTPTRFARAKIIAALI
jgi:hypothetical protein